MTYLAAFQDGLLAAKAGKKMIARLQFEQVTELNPAFSDGWLWLAWTSDSPQQAIECLEKAESLSPNNRLASVFRQVVEAYHNYELEQDFSTFLSGVKPTQQIIHDQDANKQEEPSDNSQVADSQPATANDAAPEDSNSDTRSYEEIQQELESIRNKAKSQKADDVPATREALDTNPFDEADWDATTEAAEAATAQQGEAPEESDNSTQEHRAVAGKMEPEQVRLQSVSQQQPNSAASTTEQPVGTAAASTKEPSATAAPAEDVSATATAIDSPEEKVASIATAPTASSDTSHPIEGVIETEEDVPLILAVDDSPTVRKLVTMTLKSGGYRVETAEDGVEAMKMLANITPSLILLDVNMPRMDGYKLCKLIKRHEKTKFIPVVMLSGKDGMFDKLRGTLVGCDDYIAKPFRSTDLLNHIEKYLAVPAV